MPAERIVFADIESIGLDPNGPIRQIAAVAVDDMLREVEAFDVKVAVDWRRIRAWRQRPRSSPPTPSFTSETEPAQRFAEFLSRHATLDVLTARGTTLRVAQLAAHHAAHDGPFLQAFFARNRRFYPGDYRMLCTVQRAQWFFQEHDGLVTPADFKLATLCEYFRVPFPAATRHDALVDVRATLALYREILAVEANQICHNRRQESFRPGFPEFTHTSATWYNKDEEKCYGHYHRIVPRNRSPVARPNE